MNKFLVLILAVFFMSCENIEHKSEYDKSLQKWQSFKNANKNSYRYVASGATWVGISWETEIVVENGEIVERSFRYKNFESILRPANGWDEASAKLVKEKLPPHVLQELHDRKIEILDYLEWSERKIELGTHSDTPAAALWTLDQIYVKAKDEWLVKRDNITTYFEAGNAGMLSSCGYVENNCADDCFTGISIRLIEAL
jgi:hypothetical protein